MGIVKKIHGCTLFSLHFIHNNGCNRKKVRSCIRKVRVLSGRVGTEGNLCYKNYVYVIKDEEDSKN